MELPRLSGPTPPDVPCPLAPLEATVVEVAVLGAGIVGLAIAWQLSARGVEVALIDPHPASGASFVAGGMLGGVAETGFAEADQGDAYAVAREEWDPFLDELRRSSGRGIDYCATSTILVGLDDADLASIDQLAAFQSSLGLDVTALDRRGLDATVLGLGRPVRAGYALNDSAVDNRGVLEAVLEASARSQVRLVRQVATRVERTEHDLCVHHGGGELRASVVVVATGAAPMVDLPDQASAPTVFPVGGVICRLAPRASTPSLDAVVRAVVHGRPCYLVPRSDGSIVLGATAVERGFDCSVVAGELHQLLDDGRTVWPALDDCTVADVMAGLRPSTPNHRPVVGSSPVPGLLFALGHYRNGFLLAPATARRIVASTLDHLGAER